MRMGDGIELVRTVVGQSFESPSSGSRHPQNAGQESQKTVHPTLLDLRINTLDQRINTSDVPKGPMTIAQRFNVGISVRAIISPEGTAEMAEIEINDVRSAKGQPSLRDENNARPYPNVKTLGYCRMSLRDNAAAAESLQTPGIGQESRQNQQAGNSAMQRPGGLP